MYMWISGSCLWTYKAYSGEVCPLPLQPYLAVCVFFSYKYALFLCVPEIFMDNLLKEEIWPRWVGVTGLYLMATANNLLTAERVSYLTVTMSSKGDISGCVIIAVKSIFSASKKNGKSVEWWRHAPDRLVLIIQAQPQFPLTFQERCLELGAGKQKRHRVPSFLNAWWRLCSLAVVVGQWLRKVVFLWCTPLPFYTASFFQPLFSRPVFLSYLPNPSKPQPLLLSPGELSFSWTTWNDAGLQGHRNYNRVPNLCPRWGFLLTNYIDTCFTNTITLAQKSFLQNEAMNYFSIFV